LNHIKEFVPMHFLLAPLLMLTAAPAGLIPYETITFTSTHDQTAQPARLYRAPESGPQPLLVQLHTWSSDLNSFDPDDWVTAARALGWHVVLPNFRGANKNSEACASPAARQDILDAVEAAKSHVEVDRERIYLCGVSGGGHMALVMAAHSPQTWTAVSAWVPISDLAAWHGETQAAGRPYWQDVEASVGGAPGCSAAVDEQLRLRSPIYFMANAVDVPLDINTGIHDGHDGSVPIHHSIDAFNVIAETLGVPGVSQSRINALSQEWAPAQPPVVDHNYERPIHLREVAGKARITVFEGAHDWLPPSACHWLAQHAKRKD
jgi:dipeptidyl aminopeptidase/acylaminoacyl peptidase